MFGNQHQQQPNNKPPNGPIYKRTAGTTQTPLHSKQAVEGEIPLPLPPGGSPFSWRGVASGSYMHTPSSPLMIGQENGNIEGGMTTDPTVSTSFVESTRLGRAGWISLCMAFLLFLAAVAALIVGVLLWRSAELSAGPIGPVGPPGPQGPTGNVTINGSNPLPVGDVIFFNPINTTILEVNGSFALPITWWHGDGDNVTTWSSVPNPGPGTDPLLWLETPGGLCLADPFFFNNTIYGAFSAPDCPDFAAGLQLGQVASFLKTNTPAADDVTLQSKEDLYLCTAGGAGTAHLNVGCSPRGPVELGEVQTVLSLDANACLEWEANPMGPFGGSGLCHNGTCATWKEDCLVFDGTAVSFKNGAFIEGDLFVSGNLTYTNMLEFNVSQVPGDLTVDGCLFADCVVTNNLTVGNEASYSFGATWTQAPGGSWTQQSSASFQSNVEVVGPAVMSIRPNAAITLNNGASIFHNSGSQTVYQQSSALRMESLSSFETETNVQASCDSPLFDDASGCIDCDVVAACTGTSAVVFRTTRYVMPAGPAVLSGPGLVAPIDFSVPSVANTLNASFDGTDYTLPAIGGIYSFTYSLNITSTSGLISHAGVALTTSTQTIRLICSYPLAMINLGTYRGIVCTHTGYYPASTTVRFNILVAGGQIIFERNGSYAELSLLG